MSSPPVRRSRGAATRERLLLAAVDLFTARGFHATTTAQLAARTGIAEGTIYRHFPGKQALYAAVCRAVWERCSVVAAEGDNPRGALRERLAAAARRLAAEAQRAPAIIRLLVRPVERAALDEPARKAQERFRQTIEQFVAVGKQDGSIRAGSAELWAALWFQVVAFACERVADGEWTADHANVSLAVDAAWELIGRRAYGDQ
jgi:AcrR family transcriptional regulator